MHKLKLIYLAPALALIALMAWALASPLGASPDDDFHLASIWCANAANTSACEPGTNSGERVVPPLVHNAACYAHQPNVSAICQNEFRAEGSRPTVLTDRGSFRDNYPPVYYASMSIFVGPNIEVSALIMRLANIVILIGITSALFFLLPLKRRATLIWAWVISTVPLGLFLLASNNPSAWALIGIGSAWIALLGFFETSGRRKAALGLVFALASVMAAGSRADAALYLVLSVIIVMILTFAKTRKFLISALLPFFFVVLGVYFFLSSQQSGVVATGLRSSTQPPASPSVSGLSLLLKDLMNVPSLWAGALGSWDLGWLDTSMPAVVAFGAVVVFVAIAFAGVSRTSVRKTIALVLVGAALWVLPTYVLVKGMNEVGENVQPRYLLPLMLLLAGLAMLNVAHHRITFSRAQLVVVIGLLSIAQSVALYTNIRRYVKGVAIQGWNLNSGIQWWWDTPISPMLVWVVGTVAFAALLLVLLREITKIHVE